MKEILEEMERLHPEWNEIMTMKDEEEQQTYILGLLIDPISEEVKDYRTLAVILEESAS